MYVFAWATFYPGGGWHDFIGHAHSLDTAYALIREHRTLDVYQIIDPSDGSVVEDGYIQSLLRESQRETQSWHCSRCDEDYPHVILDRAETLPEVKTKCTNCNRETWR